ncbi:hypothetical protein bAD24_p00560 (plasmid) [Burkholderia sp. AD24]|nr:hypothetical protein bAD24_p00560 [Burkholderia sp. AD24]
MTLTQRLAELGHTLPELATPAANYVHYSQGGELLVISGQIGTPRAAAAGPAGAGLSTEAARVEAERAALALLAALNAAVGGDASRIRQVLRLGVFVAAGPMFEDHGVVANGASDLVVAILGERGRHARAAIGVASLPRQAAVEVDALVWLHV